MAARGKGKYKSKSKSASIGAGARARVQERSLAREERQAARQERKARRRRRKARRRQAYLNYVEHKMKAKPAVVAVYTVLRLLILAEIVRSLVVGHYYNVFMCAIVLLLLMVPSLLERGLRIELPTMLEIIVVLFVFAAEFLGEVDAFYVKFPFWDTMLHTLWGFLCAGVGFALVDILNRSERTGIRLTPLYMAVTAVAFSVAVGTCWEIFEYTVDNVFGMDMQKDELVTSFGSVWLDPDASNAVVSVTDIASTTILLESGEQIVIEGGYLDIGIHDTMADIIVNLIGAIVFALFGYAYVKTRGKNSFVAGFIPRVLSREVIEEQDAAAERQAQDAAEGRQAQSAAERRRAGAPSRRRRREGDAARGVGGAGAGAGAGGAGAGAGCDARGARAGDADEERGRGRG